MKRDSGEIIAVPIANVATGATDELKFDTQASTLRTQAVSDTISSRRERVAPVDSTRRVDLLFDTIESVSNGETEASHVEMVLERVSSVLTQTLVAIQPRKSVVQVRAVIVAELLVLVVLLFSVSSPGLFAIRVAGQAITLPEFIPIARIVAMRAPEVGFVFTHPRKDRRASFTSNLNSLQRVQQLSTCNHSGDVNRLRIVSGISVRSTECDKQRFRLITNFERKRVPLVHGFSVENTSVSREFTQRFQLLLADDGPRGKLESKFEVLRHVVVLLGFWFWFQPLG